MTSITPINRSVVGVLELASKYRYGLTSRGAPMYLFRPYDETLPPEYIVGSTERDTTRNQIALVEITTTESSTTKPRGILIRLMGPVGDPVAERAALLQHYCPHLPLSTTPPPTDTSDDPYRIELSEETGWITFHVDPPGCRDIDDAIAWHPEKKLWAIAIADVAAAVPVDSELDKRACAIGSTFYDLDGRVVRPMLPPTISEGTASLLPGQRRRAISILFPSDAPITNVKWELCWITVAHSFTYESFAESSLITKDTDTHVWIADKMIYYNTAAAALLQTHNYGLMRVQSAADAATVAAWPSELRHLANERATYQLTDVTKDQSHAGLGVVSYAHASSPLRRYADLLNQRAIKTILYGNAARPRETPEISEHLNARADAARRWTRDLTFLTHVTPGHLYEIDVIPISATHVWVPLWKRIIRLRHDVSDRPPLRIAIFCDPTRRNWKQRILTAPVKLSSISRDGTGTT